MQRTESIALLVRIKTRIASVSLCAQVPMYWVPSFRGVPPRYPADAALARNDRVAHPTPASLPGSTSPRVHHCPPPPDPLRPDIKLAVPEARVYDSALPAHPQGGGHEPHDRSRDRHGRPIHVSPPPSTVTYSHNRGRPRRHPHLRNRLYRPSLHQQSSTSRLHRRAFVGGHQHPLRPLEEGGINRRNLGIVLVATASGPLQQRLGSGGRGWVT